MSPEEQALLQQLNDVITPGQPGWWPLAVGWWLLATLCLLLIVCILLLTKKRKQHKKAAAWRDLALQEHRRIRSETDTRVVEELSVLMRRVALAVHPRTRIASVTDEQWLASLDAIGQTSEYTEGVGQLLYRMPYRPDGLVADDDLSQLLDLTENTILRAQNNELEESGVAAL